MISKQYFETTFSLETAQTLQEWADNNLISDPSLPPVYELTEPLIDWGGFNWLVNSAEGASTYNAKLLNLILEAWTPTAQEYPADETAVIDFGNENSADTQWTPPADSEYTFTFVENVGGGSYDMVSLNPKGDGLTADVLYDGVLTAENTGLLYTPPISAIQLHSNMSKYKVPMIPTCEITMSQYVFYEGDTATVTVTFNTVPNTFVLNDLTGDNGVISNLIQTSNPWIYTATFTPDEDVNDNTNVITASWALGEFQDKWGNANVEDFQSSNYTVNTALVTLFDMIVNFDNNSPDIAGITVNTANDYTLNNLPADLLNTTNVATGISFGNLTNPCDTRYSGNASHGVCMGYNDLALRCWAPWQQVGIDITLPAGTYTISVLASIGAGGTTYETVFSLTGEADIQVDASNDNTGSHCGEWTDITGGTTVTFGANNDGGGYGCLSAIKITRTA